jgi:pyruvate/oxaloacetate carboxyltransferase
MKRSRNLLALVVVLSLMSTAACIHKTNQAAVTPWERVTTYNAALAQANNTAEQGAEAIVSSGLATPAQAAPIILATGRVAGLHLQVTAVLKQGTASQVNVASIKAMVDQIHASINAVPVVSLGIKNPKSQQSFAADLKSISTLADAVLASLEAVQ